MTASAPDLARRQRARGRAHVAFAERFGAVRVSDLEQGGSLRVMFPRPEPGEPLCAALANIGGGVAGGDELAISAHWREGAEAVVTSQAAEKVYRAVDHVPARIETRLTVAAGARALWLPQETIVFEGARLERGLDAELAEDSSLIACESLVFGRTARGERVETGRVFDRWRVRVGGRLVYADALELDGAVAATLDARAVGDGAVAVASLLMVAPDAEARLGPLRAALAPAEVEWGASAFDGCVAARFVARSALALRRALGSAVTSLSGRRPPRLFAF